MTLVLLAIVLRTEDHMVFGWMLLVQKNVGIRRQVVLITLMVYYMMLKNIHYIGLVLIVNILLGVSAYASVLGLSAFALFPSRSAGDP